MIRGTVCGNVCTYGSVGALGEQSPRATRKSSKDSDICLRGLDHIVQDYKKFRATTKGREKLPYPILICLYHGKTPWEHVPTMDELVEIIPGMQTGLLKYTMILIDISPLMQEEFVGHPVLQVVLEMLQRAFLSEVFRMNC